MSNLLSKLGYFEDGEFIETNMRAQDIVDSAGVSAEQHQTNAAIHLTPEQSALIASAIQSSLLGAADGVATLGADGKLTPTQIDLTKYQASINTATYEDMLALDTTVKNGCPVNNYVFVTDATGDSSVESGWAIYRRVGTGNTAADFVKTSEQESMDVILPDFVAMDSRISDNETAASAAQSAAQTADGKAVNAQSTADDAASAAAAAATEAARLDFAFCESEDDMRTKNLRNGALVLMKVTS